MDLAKQFLLENRFRFYDDATLQAAWKDAERVGTRTSKTSVEFKDGSRLEEDPLTSSVVCYPAPTPTSLPDTDLTM